MNSNFWKNFYFRKPSLVLQISNYASHKKNSHHFVRLSRPHRTRCLSLLLSASLLKTAAHKPRPLCGEFNPCRFIGYDHSCLIRKHETTSGFERTSYGHLTPLQREQGLRLGHDAG